MHGVRGVCNVAFFLVLIFGLIFSAVSADLVTDTTDPVNSSELVNETVNQSVTSSITTTTTEPTPEPTAAKTVTLTTATTEPTLEPTAAQTIAVEETVLPSADETTISVPAEPTVVTTTTTDPTPGPTVTPENTLNEIPALKTGSSRETMETQSGSLSETPMNPAFLEYQNRAKQSVGIQSNGLQTRAMEGAAFTTIQLNDGSTTQVFLEGEIPSPIDFSYTRGQQVSLDAVSFDADSLDAVSYLDDGSGYPGSYDLRSLGRVTSVKDQGQAGSCWAFATIASLESSLLTGENWDFSENNMKNTLAYTYTDGFDRTWDDGGNRDISTAYLTRWSGPVLESDDPYSDKSGISPSGLHTYKHVQNVYFLPERSSSIDNDNIKNALTNVGAVQASIYYNNSYYNGAHAAFYNDGSLIGIDPNQTSTTKTNHAITIVGWDDSYSSANFADIPGGNGAFIVKNSWGTGWGDSGYFYISYYDLTIGNLCAVFTGAPVTNYDRIYSYDPLGWISSYYITQDPTEVQYANVYTAQSAESLNAIGLYAYAPSSYTARIYLDPSSGPINTTGYVAETSWTSSNLGYQTVAIPDVGLKTGQKYSIVVNVTTTSGNYATFNVERPIADYSSHATANAGESYYSQNGTYWTDLTTQITNANVCLKGYTTRQMDIGVYRSGGWILDYGINGVVDRRIGYGLPTDVPVVGDFNNDGQMDIGVYRSGEWILDYGIDGTVDRNIYYGLATDVPVVGDFNNDGRMDIGVFRSGGWILDYGIDGVVDRRVYYGLATDVPVVGDFNNDGRTDIGVFRSGGWILDYGIDGVVDRRVYYGLATDVPVVGDFNNDGRMDIGVFRSGGWILDYGINGIVDRRFGYGLPTDKPIVGKFN